MSEIQEQFEAAAKTARALPRQPDSDTLLLLYSLYKQATQDDISVKRPGFTDPVGRAKWDAWAKHKGMPSQEAMQSYIVLVNRLK
jgi:acyl-CoA-binding protein